MTCENCEKRKRYSIRVWKIAGLMMLSLAPALAVTAMLEGSVLAQGLSVGFAAAGAWIFTEEKLHGSGF